MVSFIVFNKKVYKLIFLVTCDENELSISLELNIRCLRYEHRLFVLFYKSDSFFWKEFMAVNLVKGQRSNIETNSFNVGLGWDINSRGESDLDVTAFMLDESGNTISESFIVFYNQLESADKAVVHTGDNRTGDGDGDDEVISVDISKLDSRVDQIVFVVTIHEAEERGQNFGQVRNSYIRITDKKSNEEIMIYELDEDYSVEKSIEFGRLYKRSGQWKFEAMGIGYMEDLGFFVQKYGLEV
ncbi:chemical-damaging agent resistance protein C [Aureibacter tunicatorum]|nr:chemical-damaging agent resistance protein C [Aureibacter tunicatorum]